MTRTYDFDYNFMDAGCTLKVDLDKFLPESAKELLEFFTWEYDHHADPIDELMKKYAMQAIKISTFSCCNEYGVKEWFAGSEGFIALDGSQGVELTYVSEYEFIESSLTVEILHK